MLRGAKGSGIEEEEEEEEEDEEEEDEEEEEEEEEEWPVHRADNLTTFIPTVLKSGSLNLLEPSGSVQACSGIVLPTFHAEGSVL